MRISIWAAATAAILIWQTTVAGAHQGQQQQPQPEITQSQFVQAMHNVQGEYTTCAAFYWFSEQCLRLTDPVLSGRMQSLAAHAVEMAAGIGKIIGMTSDAMQSRAKMEKDAIMRLTSASCVNGSSAIQRYARRCQRVTIDGKGVLAEHLNRP
jgi:hypothetical protein